MALNINMKSREASNTVAFDMGVDARDLECCVVCGRISRGGPYPGVQRAHIIDKTEDILVRDCFMLYLNNSQLCIVGLPEGQRFCSFFC